MPVSWCRCPLQRSGTSLPDLSMEAVVPAASPTFRSGPTALVRAVALPTLPIPPVPDLEDRSPEGDAHRLAWLRAVRSNVHVSEALGHASPVLTDQVQALCTVPEPSPRDIRRAALSVARYLLRAQHRPTPFGLFADVTTARIGGWQARADWGPDCAVATRAGAEWLAVVIGRLEACTELVHRLPVWSGMTLSPPVRRGRGAFQREPQLHRSWWAKADSCDADRQHGLPAARIR